MGCFIVVVVVAVVAVSPLLNIVDRLLLSLDLRNVDTTLRSNESSDGWNDGKRPSVGWYDNSMKPINSDSSKRDELSGMTGSGERG